MWESTYVTERTVDDIAVVLIPRLTSVGHRDKYATAANHRLTYKCGEGLKDTLPAHALCGMLTRYWHQ